MASIHSARAAGRLVPCLPGQPPALVEQLEGAVEVAPGGHDERLVVEGLGDAALRAQGCAR